MKSVTEILGGAQILFDISFDLQDSFEEYLTEQHKAFLAMLRVIEEYLPAIENEYTGRGRIPPARGGVKRTARVTFNSGKGTNSIWM